MCSGSPQQKCLQMGMHSDQSINKSLWILIVINNELSRTKIVDNHPKPLILSKILSFIKKKSAWTQTYLPAQGIHRCNTHRNRCSNNRYRNVTLITKLAGGCPKMKFGQIVRSLCKPTTEKNFTLDHSITFEHVFCVPAHNALWCFTIMVKHQMAPVNKKWKHPKRKPGWCPQRRMFKKLLRRINASSKMAPACLIVSRSPLNNRTSQRKICNAF